MKSCSLLVTALLALPLAASASEPLDRDASDRVDAAERRVLNETVEVHFQHLDTDGDGALTLGEVPRDYLLYRDFARWDDNHDGVINMYEFDGYVDQLAQL